MTLLICGQPDHIVQMVRSIKELASTPTKILKEFDITQVMPGDMVVADLPIPTAAAVIAQNAYYYHVMPCFKRGLGVVLRRYHVSIVERDGDLQ